MTVEQQLSQLALLGIRLDPGVTVEDVVAGLGRKALEKAPFDPLLIVLGDNVDREPYDQPICSRAWNFDTECIYETGAYVEIVRTLLRVAGKPADYFKELQDNIDADSGEVWLEYQLPDGEYARWDFELDSDWANADVVEGVMRTIESDGGHFYGKDNGQATVIYYLDDRAAEALKKLSKGQLSRLLNEDGAVI